MAQNVRIVEVNPENEWVTLKNYGSESVDISGYWLCQRPEYDQLGESGSIGIVSGDLVLDPMEEVIVNVSPAGQSGGFTAIVDLPENGELGLFANSSFGSTDPSILLDFVSWGGVTSPTRANQAVEAGRWDAEDSFVDGGAPFTYIGGANDAGASFWEGEEAGNAIVRIVEVNPENEWVTLKNFGTDTIDISGYWLCQRPEYDQLGESGSIAIVSGDFVLDPMEEVIVNVSPAGQSGGFTAIVDLPENGELGLFANSSFGSTDPSILLDFVSWGGVTAPTRANQAVEAGRWDAEDSFVDGGAPFTYIGGANDVGASFWEGEEAGNAIVRIVEVNPENEWVTLKNFGTDTIDISGYWLCQRPEYDQLGESGSIAIVSGDFVLDPMEEVIVNVSPAGQSGGFTAIVDLPENGELGLFASATFGSTDPSILLDFVSWGGVTAPTRANQAVEAGRWDAEDSFVDGSAPFTYIGGANDVGASFWEGEEAGNAIVRIVEVNPENEWVTLKNFGTDTIDISGYWLCQRPEYDQLGESGSIAIVSGDFVLDPMEEVIVNVSPAGQSGGFTAIVDLPENGELGLFANSSFGSTDPSILLDFVSWGGVTSPTRANQAVEAGRWDAEDSFVDGAAPFTYIGGANDVGASFWEGEEAGNAIVRIVEVNPENEWVTLKNFGTGTIDISGYWLCQRPEYDQLGESGSIAIVSGDFVLDPMEEVIVNVSPAGQSGSFNAIVDLPENGELGLFASATFGSTDPSILLDFVSWGGVTAPTRANQAVEAGRWDAEDSFVDGAAPFTYIGGANDVGASFWRGEFGNGFVLVDAVEDVAIDDFNPIAEGAVIDLSLLPTLALNIVAELGATDFSKVVFTLNGENVRTEFEAPYTLFGDVKGDFAAGSLPVGTHELVATPYRGDVASTPLSVRFSVEDGELAVLAFVIVDADSDQEVLTIYEGAEIDAATLPAILNVVAKTSDDVASLLFDLNYGHFQRLENEAPFSLFGDTGNDFFAGNLPPGSYVLEATPFSEILRRGEKGTPLSVRFTIKGTETAGKTLPEGYAEEKTIATGDAPEQPATIDLETNYPNPFNPETTIAFTVQQSADVQITIYDALGRRVATLVDGVMPQGRHEVRFQAGDLPSGAYFYRLITPTQTLVRQMLLLK